MTFCPLHLKYCVSFIRVSNLNDPKDLLEFLKFYSIYHLLEFQILNQKEEFEIPFKMTTFRKFEILPNMNSWNSDKKKRALIS